MSAVERVEALAEAITAATGLTCYAEPGSPGRGDVFAYVDAPTFAYESAARAFCVSGRSARLRASVVIVGAGVAPGQLLALLAAAESVVSVADSIAGWIATGDATPATFADSLPAYSIPLATTA